MMTNITAWFILNEPIILAFLGVVGVVLLVFILFFVRKSLDKKVQVNMVPVVEKKQNVHSPDHIEAIKQELSKTVQDIVDTSITEKIKIPDRKKNIPISFDEDRFKIHYVGCAKIHEMNLRVDVFNFEDKNTKESYMFGVYNGHMINFW